MAKHRSRRIAADDEGEEQETRKHNECSTLDHIYPGNPPGPDTKCYCGKRTFQPFIRPDDRLKVGELVRTYRDGPVYEVEMVNQSRARCRVITTNELQRRKEDAKPIFMPLPGMPEAVQMQATPTDADNEEDERRGRVINISPRSVVIRVSAAEFEEETLNRRSSDMAKSNIASIPVAGKQAKLATKPTSAAKPLTGAAAKAKAAARPKTPKTVRQCGCGCGGETMAYFVPGHDARYKGWIKKLASGELDQAGLKKLMGKQFAKYTFKKVGAGFAPKETYQEAAEA